MKEENNKSPFSLVTITGNSWSGKSFLGEELIKQGWKEVISFTTRPPRNDSELDRYVFVTDEMFEQLKAEWRFMESVEYKGNKYALSAHLPQSHCFAIVEPNGREQVLNWSWPFHKVHTTFIEISEEERRRRLLERDWNLDRKNDNFAPTENCLILNWEESRETNYKRILEYIKA